MAANRNVTIDYYNELFFIREQEIERLKTDNTSINRFVVSEAILKCLQLLDACFGNNSKLYTDGIFISNPKIRFKNKKDVKFSTNKIGKEYVTDSRLVYFEKCYRENMTFEDYKIKKGRGCIYIGQAGSGKTTKLCQMVMEAKKSISIIIHK